MRPRHRALRAGVAPSSSTIEQRPNGCLDKGDGEHGRIRRAALPCATNQHHQAKHHPQRLSLPKASPVPPGRPARSLGPTRRAAGRPARRGGWPSPGRRRLRRWRRPQGGLTSGRAAGQRQQGGGGKPADPGGVGDGAGAQVPVGGERAAGGKYRQPYPQHRPSSSQRGGSAGPRAATTQPPWPRRRPPGGRRPQTENRLGA